ncbi:D-alanyl-D-alanine carboxypeptidase family protein [Cellulosilyticum sp. I15G10I2]|uniref:D-alanyl-D-alanine carboxypeptidase family protein n=1 Tax=Cellulosilyticum sp. I15G10I2 TaxID=1892843 RepID=UPI00085BCA2D|nr:D-alanyl-D-alanine carboxypeptidase family protein [Cellulosilyticum sp. I15G10I2]
MRRIISLSLCLLIMFLGIFPTRTMADTATENLPVIQAESAILIDAKSKTVLFEKNAHKKQYPASITKIMTALLAIENLSPTDLITFSKEAIFSIERGSSHIGMDVGEQITVDQALHGVLLMSANEVANGLAEAASGSIENFGVKMTERAKELGAVNTHFVNPHGLHSAEQYTTAYDMALITSYIYNNSYFSEIMSHTTYQIPSTNKTTETRYLSQQHRLMNQQRDSKMYRADVIAGKTGYTDVARHTLVTVAKHGDIDLVAVILKSERDSLYTDTNALLNYGINSYRTLNLHSTGTSLKTLPMYSVKSGQTYQAGNCSISVETPLSILIQKDIKERDITTHIDLPEYIEIGTSKGSTIGTITYLHGTQILAKNNLLIKDIEFSPSPYPTVLPVSNTLLIDKKIYFIVIPAVLIVFFISVLRRIFKRRRRKKVAKLKFNRRIK